MATIKKSKLKEVLSARGITEGIIDTLINAITTNKANKKSNELKDKLKKTRDSLRNDFIEFYGSYDSIPDSVKKIIEK